MLSPEDIEDRRFLVSLRGYDRIEVQGFLAKVAAHVRDLEARLATAERAAARVQADPQERQRELQAARDEATDILHAARNEAARVLQTAHEEAARLAVDSTRQERPAHEAPPAREETGTPTAFAPPPRPPKSTAAYERPQRSPGDDASAETDVTPAAGPAESAVAPAERAAGPADPHVLRREALEPLHPQLVRRIQGGLEETRTLVLYRLSRSEASRPPLTVNEVVARLAATAAELLEAAYRAGEDAAGRLSGQRLDGPSGTRRDLAGPFVAAAAEHLAGPITGALEDRQDPPGVGGDRLGAAFSGIEDTVAEELAATQLIMAYELGKLDAWSAGGVSHRRWVLGREPRCPQDRCRRNDEVGEVAVGRPYPSGHDTPPVHVGCTCTTVPVSEPPR